MMELLSMLRPLTTRQMLLGVCLLDLALIAMRLSWPGMHAPPASQSHQQHPSLQDHSLRLRELLTRQADLSRQLEGSKRQLEESRRHLLDLMAFQASRDAAEAEQLSLLVRGVEDLEHGLAGLLAARAGGATGYRNDTLSELVT